MAYRLLAFDYVLRLADGVTIPPDPENIYRAAYNLWLAEGGVSESNVPPQSPPLRVLSVLEFRDRLILAVPTAIAGIYGMNFDNMPELKTQYGYYVVFGVIAVVCAGLYVKFRKAKWL